MRRLLTSASSRLLRFLDHYQIPHLSERRAESPKAYSPGHRPVEFCLTEFIRPEWAKAFFNIRALPILALSDKCGKLINPKLN